MLRAFGVSDKGRVRATNEDCFAIDPDRQVFIVADGMGGHNAGEVASRVAVDSVLAFVADPPADDRWPYGYDPTQSREANLLRTALQVANRSVFDTAGRLPDCSGMGTTVVAMLARGSALVIAHVGDSRAYAVSRDGAEQLTTDDSWTATMLARDPSLDPAVLKNHPMRNALTSVIGSRPQVDVHVTERQLTAGDLLVLTTDGVHGVLDDADVMHACYRSGDLADMAGQLVQDALDRGSRDNCTAVVARYEQD